MLDVIAPSSGGPVFAKKVSTRKPSNHVLKVAWKLPARLRKPVKQQLKAERRAKQKRMVGGFARRELNTRDMYREGGPERHLVAPPYVGGVVRRRMHELTPIPTPEVETAQAIVQQPKRRLKLPFSIDWLTPLRPERVLAKKKIFSFDRNIAILLIGCFISSGAIWNMQGLGRGWGVLAKVENQATQALGKLGSAQAALASSDFAASEAAFSDAQELLSRAQQQFDEALATSQYAIQRLDVTGTVRSGAALLQAGEELTQAGQHISRALAAASAAAPIQAIETAKHELTRAEELLGHAESNLKHVTSALLPKEIIQSAAQLSGVVPRVRQGLSQFLKQSDLLLTVLGAERDRQYLLLFANNHELRPVGGFLGSLALVNVDRGKVENVDVQTVYDGDGQLKEFIAPPDPLLSIVNRWYLRDSNWFVDFPVSARKAADFLEKEGGPTVDGVILMTPEIIQDLLRLTGPVTVPGYDVAVSADNFAEVTQREVTYEYDRGLNRPKQFLADLTPLLLNRLLSDRGNAQLLSLFTRSLAQKDLLFFFRDQAVQTQVVALGWGGSIPKDAAGFLYVNNANIGGHKSDQFMEQEIDYRVEIARDGEVEVVLTVRRNHRGLEEGRNYPYPSGENPSLKDNIIYQRVLVPTGAQLLEARGFATLSDVPRMPLSQTNLTLTPDSDIAEWQRGQIRHDSGTIVGQEAGYTFFANWIVTKPGETTVGVYRYVWPKAVARPGVLNAASRFSTYVSKQPGAVRNSVRVAVKLPEGAAMLKTLPESGITRESEREFVYRGELTHDLVLGAVYGK